MHKSRMQSLLKNSTMYSFFLPDGGASLLLGTSPPSSQLPRYERPEPLLGSDDACSSSPSQL